jgi:hypothetical protein
MVTLRGPSAKHFWDGLEEFGALLEELGIGSERIERLSLLRRQIDMQK